jgi:hypothetical protein
MFRRYPQDWVNGTSSDNETSMLVVEAADDTPEAAVAHCRK